MCADKLTVDQWDSTKVEQVVYSDKKKKKQSCSKNIWAGSINGGEIFFCWQCYEKSGGRVQSYANF